MTGEVAALAGPKGEDFVPEEYSQSFAQVISLYPMNMKLSIREGDPICDAYRVHTSDTGSIWCLADGCNWGPRPFQAANRCVFPLFLPLLMRTLIRFRFLALIFYTLTQIMLTDLWPLNHEKALATLS